ncbi:MAG: GIDE domain-containing protein [Spongiibacteraceae bacterium]
MNYWSFLSPALMVLCAGGGIALMAINLRKARIIEDTPSAKIRSAAQGYLSVSGMAKAIDNDIVLAALTGQPCLWYHYTIERYDRDGKHSRWTTIESGTSEKFFALDDNTGVCHIDPRRAEVATAISQRWEGDERKPYGAPRQSSVFGFSNRYRYTENRIHAQEWVYVLGWFETLHAPSLAERTQEQTKLLLNAWKQDRDALLARFDLNRDGEISLQEWERARRAAQQQAQLDVRDQLTVPPVNTMSRSPLRDQPYLIGTKDPLDMSRKYRRDAVISLGAGFAFAAFIFWKFYGY